MESLDFGLSITLISRDAFDRMTATEKAVLLILENCRSEREAVNSRCLAEQVKDTRRNVRYAVQRLIVEYYIPVVTFSNSQGGGYYIADEPGRTGAIEKLKDQLVVMAMKLRALCPKSYGETIMSLYEEHQRFTSESGESHEKRQRFLADSSCHPATLTLEEQL